MRLTGKLAFFALFLSGCGGGDATSREQSVAGDDGATPGGESKNEETEDPEEASLPSLSELFRDQMTAPRKLGTGTASCAGLEGQESLEGGILPWPGELKSFLLRELEQFPETKLFRRAVHGIYLAQGKYLQTSSAQDAGVVAGLMCDTEDDDKSHVFLNYDMFVTERKAEGPLGEWQSFGGLINPHVVTLHGDQALYTLFHELFHAVDRNLFVEGGDEELLSARWPSRNFPGRRPTPPCSSRSTSSL